MLVIGDPHASPRYRNDRFRDAGEAAAEWEVDRVLCVGDWTDFESLLSHGSPESQEGLRYVDDVAAGADALAQFDRGLGSHRPKKDITLGNHDMRPDRRAATFPELLGHMRWDEVPFRKHGWRCTPWKSVVQIGPFACTHHFTTAMGRPLSGKHLARRIVETTLGSAIVGHDHRWQWHESSAPVGGRTHYGLVAGTLTHPDMRNAGWCSGQAHEWRSRLTYLAWDRAGVVTDLRFVEV